MTAARLVLAAAALLSAAFLWTAVSPLVADDTRVVPPLAAEAPEPQASGMQTAVFAGGCFWGVQGVFQHVKGVANAVSGYTGGKQGAAHYSTVGTGMTGHAESVNVTFDPRTVSYAHLLQIYFSVAHDPTELNRQGPDSGTQYRSAIFPTTPEQAKIAKAYVDQLNQAHVFNAGRDQHRARSHLLSGRGLPPELPDAQSG